MEISGVKSGFPSVEVLFVLLRISGHAHHIGGHRDQHDVHDLDPAHEQRSLQVVVRQSRHSVPSRKPARPHPYRLWSAVCPFLFDRSAKSHLSGGAAVTGP
jgi:hypothetical protein